MDINQLFENERLITESDNKSIFLSNVRIRQNNSFMGKANLISIHLEKISSIEVRYVSWFICLIVGIVLIAAGLIMGAQNQGDAMVAGIAVGLLLVFIYFLSRKHVVLIASDGGAKINFVTKGMKKEVIYDFVSKVERAKYERTLELRK